VGNAFNVASNVNLFVSQPGINYFNNYIERTTVVMLKIKIKIILVFANLTTILNKVCTALKKIHEITKNSFTNKFECHKINLYEDLDKGNIILYLLEHRRLSPVNIINN